MRPPGPNAQLGAPGSVGPPVPSSTAGNTAGNIPLGARMPNPSPSDAAVDAVLAAVQDIRNNISGLLLHIETQTEYLSWPFIMDRFSLISSQMANLAKTMKNEKMSDLRKMAVVPSLVTQDPDQAVEKLTDGRITAVNHEIVPSYLRTKLDPAVEERFEEALKKVPQNVPDAVQKAEKQVQHLNKLVGSLLEHVESAKHEWDSKSAARSLPATYAAGDTHALLAAVTHGVGLPKPSLSGRSNPLPQSGPSGIRPNIPG